jgi:hypothetical protein
MLCKTPDNLFSQRSWCSVLFQEMLVEIYDPSTVFLAYKNAKLFEKADNSSVVIERRFLQRTAGVGAEVAVCHGLRHSCLMGNCAPPSVRCNYPSYTSVVYSHSCISTARSYTQYNLSSILQSFLHTRCSHTGTLSLSWYGVDA